MLKLIRHAVLILLLSSQWLPAQVYYQGIIGYHNRVFFTGDNLFVVPFQIGLTNNNHLSTIFGGNIIPDGSSISFWNPASASFATNSVFQSGVWSEDLTLTPGTAARLNAITTFTNVFAGVILNHDGTMLNINGLSPPPLFAGPSGVYLFGDAAPLLDNTGNDVFLNVIGRAPNVGEQVSLLDGLTQTYATSTYLGGGSWDVVPVLNLSEAAFFNISAVPEPSIAALGAIGLAGLAFLCRRLR